ncbi:MAG: hypothetical protein H0U64_05540 [Gemmatimonadaceae bacterium]|nr:hypothetical protein [Gemmatimonadaceae bacterium]
MSKKPSSPKKRERMYFRDGQGPFRPLENISVTVQAPNRKETVHGIQRRIILGDDATRSVLTIGSEFAIYHNAEMDATLVTVEEPSATVWQRLKSHMEAEDTEIEVQRAARASRNAGRGRAAAPSQSQI